MATKTIAWETGGGYITLTYSGTGNASVSVTSNENDTFDAREQSVRIATTAGSPSKAIDLLIRQKGKTYPVGEVFNFGYTGSVQQITLPKGKYKLQCWGAQGGNVSGSYTQAGSKGGYSEGVLTLTKATTIYIFVGGQGTSSSTTSTSGTGNGGWNGGGASIKKSSYSSGDTDGESFPRPGGGATDMCLVTSSMSYSSGRTNRSSASLLSRFIVAGGGAGASAFEKTVTETITSTTWEEVASTTANMTDGSAVSSAAVRELKVTLQAGITYKKSHNYSGSSLKYFYWYTDSYAFIASSNEYTPTTSGTYRVLLTSNSADDIGRSVTLKVDKKVTTESTNTSTSSGKSNASQQGGGASGRGQYPGTATSAGTGGSFGLGANQTTTGYRYCSGAGGGGWYGGGCGKSDSSTSYVNYSGGGSGFVNIAANASSRPSGYTGLQLDSGTTYAGNSSFPSPSGGNETGHSGNGYARITVLA